MFGLFSCGRSDRIRTCGIDVPNVARYQLRHTPKFDFASFIIAENRFIVKGIFGGNKERSIQILAIGRASREKSMGVAYPMGG